MMPHLLRGDLLRQVGHTPPLCEKGHLDRDELALGIGDKRLDDRIVDALNKHLKVLVDGEQPAN